MTKKCFRCGKCCDEYFGIIPKTKKDDLSPRFLATMNFDDSQEYIKNHSELMGHPCKWLMHTKNKLTKCVVYSHRSSDCRNYPEGEGDCRVGNLTKIGARNVKSMSKKALTIEMEWKLLERIAEFYAFPSAVFLMQKKDFPKITRDEILARKAKALDEIREIIEEEYQ